MESSNWLYTISIDYLAHAQSDINAQQIKTPCVKLNRLDYATAQPLLPVTGRLGSN